MRLLTLYALGAIGACAQVAGFEGDWLGTLDTGAAKLRIGLHVTRAASGELHAKMDSIDQGAMGIPIDAITADQQTLRFSIKAIGGSYEGTLRNGRIEGTWSQGPNSLPLTFGRAANIEPPRRPQEAAALPSAYRSEEVTVDRGGVTLAGTLTFPNSGGPFAAVLLVTGSGPQDRDETVFGHKPFLVISDYLTKAGFAVLRLDDRGTGKSGGKFSEAGMEEFTSDALAAVAYLKTRKELNPARIGIMGHSEGGSVAPLAATRSKDVAFVVMISGMGVPLEEVLYQQAADIMRASGAPDAAIAANRKIQERLIAIIREEADPAKAKARVLEYAAEVKKTDAQLGALIERQSGLASREIHSLLQFDPAKTLAAVQCPVLALFGEKDLQVSADQNLPAVAAALAKGHNPAFQIDKLPGLNHLYQTAKTGSPTEYLQLEETFSPQALRVIGDWLAARWK